jgi:hypothetical protein
MIIFGVALICSVFGWSSQQRRVFGRHSVVSILTRRGSPAALPESRGREHLQDTIRASTGHSYRDLVGTGVEQ